jgi:hypothetical protein
LIPRNLHAYFWQQGASARSRHLTSLLNICCKTPLLPVLHVDHTEQRHASHSLSWSNWGTAFRLETSGLYPKDGVGDRAIANEVCHMNSKLLSLDTNIQSQILSCRAPVPHTLHTHAPRTLFYTAWRRPRPRILLCCV